MERRWTKWKCRISFSLMLTAKAVFGKRMDLVPGGKTNWPLKYLKQCASAAIRQFSHFYRRSNDQRRGGRYKIECYCRVDKKEQSMAGCVGPVERHSRGVNFHDLQDSTPNQSLETTAGRWPGAMTSSRHVYEVTGAKTVTAFLPWSEPPSYMTSSAVRTLPSSTSSSLTDSSRNRRHCLPSNSLLKCAMSSSDGLVGSPSRESIELLHQTRLVRITLGGFAI